MSSIRRHLTLRLAAGFSALLLTSSLATYFSARHFLTFEFDSALRARLGHRLRRRSP